MISKGTKLHNEASLIHYIPIAYCLIPNPLKT